MRFNIDTFHELPDGTYTATIHIDKHGLSKMIKVWIEAMNDNIDQDLYWQSRALQEKKEGGLE